MVSTSTKELLELIRKKAEGGEIVAAPEAQKANVIDLMQALQASLQLTQAKYKEETKETRAAKEQKDEEKPALAQSLDI